MRVEDRVGCLIGAIENNDDLARCVRLRQRRTNGAGNRSGGAKGRYDDADGLISVHELRAAP